MAFGNQLLVSGGVASLVGEYMEGGVVFFDDMAGTAYVTTTSELSISEDWGSRYAEVFANNNEMGGGIHNTNVAISGNSGILPIAASVARAQTTGGYSDWYLPNLLEWANIMLTVGPNGTFPNAGGFILFENRTYWTSLEDNTSRSYYHNVRNDGTYNTGVNLKTVSYFVKPMRRFFY